jgi:hypothetical protein
LGPDPAAGATLGDARHPVPFPAGAELHSPIMVHMHQGQKKFC